MRIPSCPQLTRTAWLLAALLCTGAAAPMEAAPASTEASWLTQSAGAVGGAWKSLGAGAASAWGAIAGLVTPSQPFESLPHLIDDDDRRFFAVLDAVGLQLSEITLGGSLLSSTRYRLVAAREPSAADFERAEHMLADYRSSSGGLRAAARQRIARAVLDLAGDKDFFLSAVVIELSPWPSASYEVTARNRPPEAAERRLLDSLRAQ